MDYQYEFEAAKLLNRCVCELDSVLDEGDRGESVSKLGTRISGRGLASLKDLRRALLLTIDLLTEYFQRLLEDERATAEKSSPVIQELYPAIGLPTSFLSRADLLRAVVDAKKKEREKQQRKKREGSPTSETGNYFYSIRNATDSLLFRLIVSLQLCLLRIDDGHSVVRGRRRLSQTSIYFGDLSSSRQLSIGWPLAVTGSFGITAMWFMRNGPISRISRIG